MRTLLTSAHRSSGPTLDGILGTSNLSPFVLWDAAFDLEGRKHPTRQTDRYRGSTIASKVTLCFTAGQEIASPIQNRVKCE